MWDFGRAELLEPEAIGEPGQRTFRLRVLSGSEAASLWLEKEQLVALTLAIRQLLEQTDEEDASSEAGPSPPVTRSRNNLRSISRSAGWASATTKGVGSWWSSLTSKRRRRRTHRPPSPAKFPAVSATPSPSERRR